MCRSLLLFALVPLVACDGGTSTLAGPESEAGALDLQSVSLLAPNTWAFKRSMLSPARSMTVAGTIGNFIYVVGGARHRLFLHCRVKC
jgi:hypothetical protein